MYWFLDTKVTKPSLAGVLNLLQLLKLSVLVLLSQVVVDYIGPVKNQCQIEQNATQDHIPNDLSKRFDLRTSKSERPGYFLSAFLGVLERFWATLGAPKTA